MLSALLPGAASPCASSAPALEPLEPLEALEPEPEPRDTQREQPLSRETLPQEPLQRELQDKPDIASVVASMTTMIDTDTVRAAYEDVRSDTSDTEWAVFKFRDQTIFCSAVGVGFEDFRNCFNDDERAFGYIRIQMGDEISKRQKFIFVTWVGPNVAVLRRAKMSIDKAMVKGIVKSFAVELQLETLAEVDAEYFRDQLSRAGGANYGTGVSRDL